MIEIAFSDNPFDVWRLGRAGGHVHIKPDGKPVFRFETKEQFDVYMELNAERPKRKDL